MGGQDSKPKSQDETLKINHIKFINAKLVNLSQEEDGIEVSLPVANETQVKLWQSQLKNIPVNSHLLLLPRKHSFKKEGYCGSSGYANIVYDNFPFLLSDEIYNRQSMDNKKFQENEIWYLIYTLLSVGNLMHVQGRKVGDIRPENIFINEDGQVKVANTYSWPSQQTNYWKTFYEKEVTYLSPQQLIDIRYGKMDPSTNFQVAQAFSVGLTILDTALLTHSKDLYDKNFKFDYEKLDTNLHSLIQQGYSQLLSMVVENLCSVQFENRCTCRELFQWLRPFQDSIVALEDFEVSGVPEKVLATRKEVKGNQYNRENSRKQFFQTYSNNQPYPPSQSYQQSPPRQTYTFQGIVQRQQPYNRQQKPQQQYQQGSRNVQTVQYENRQISDQNPITNHNNNSNIYNGQGGQNGIVRPNQQTTTNTVNYNTYSAIEPYEYYGNRNNSYIGNNINATNVERSVSTGVTGGNLSEVNKGNNNDMKSYLDRIDEQLRQSRKNFPT